MKVTTVNPLSMYICKKNMEPIVKINNEQKGASFLKTTHRIVQYSIMKGQSKNQEI